MIINDPQKQRVNPTALIEQNAQRTVVKIDARPRPFSPLNSPHTLSVCTAIFAGVALFVPFKGGKRFVWQYPVSLIYILGCLATIGRSGIFIMPITLVGWLCFRRKWTTCLFYGTILGALMLLMFNAETVLERLGSLENLLPMNKNSDISTEAFHLGTLGWREAEPQEWIIADYALKERQMICARCPFVTYALALLQCLATWCG